MTGTLSPDATGTYDYQGLLGGFNFWTRAGGFMIAVDPNENIWRLSDNGPTPQQGVDNIWDGPAEGSSPLDDYGPVAPATGVATVAVA